MVEISDAEFYRAAARKILVLGEGSDVERTFFCVDAAMRCTEGYSHDQFWKFEDMFPGGWSMFGPMTRETQLSKQLALLFMAEVVEDKKE